MDPIFLYPEENKGKYYISIGKSNDLLSTPGGNLIESHNEALIENLVYELQKNAEVIINKDNALEGFPLETVSIYSLLCTQIDFWNDPNRHISLEDAINIIENDPIAHLSAGPEQVDQMHQWRSVTIILEENGISWGLLQSIGGDKKEVEKLANIIMSDFNNSRSSEKSAFIQLNHIMQSPVFIWAYIYKNLSIDAFVTATTQTANFIVGLETHVDDKLDEITPEGLNEDERTDFYHDNWQKIYKKEKINFYNEFEQLVQSTRKFINLSQENVSEFLCDESISHEFKASLRTPYPDYPKLQNTKTGKEIYKIGNQEFGSTKQIHIFFQDIALKAIASLLNTKGGKLIIGVHEKNNIKNVVGIDREGFESHDHYERHLVGLMTNAFDTVIVSKFISTKIQLIKGIPVCVVSCEKYNGNECVWFKDKLYVRTGPRVDELKGKEQADFILQRQDNKG